MELLVLSYVLIFLVLLILSGFFSASETSFFSLSAAEIDRLRSQNEFPARQVVALLSHSKKLLISIVIGNTIVNIAAASLAAILTLDICMHYGLDIRIGIIIDIIVVTFVLLIFSEIVPKIVAVKNSRKVALNFAFPLTVFFYLFSPIVSIFYTFTEWLAHLFRVDKSKVLLSEEELRSFLDVGHEKGTLEQDEKEMIHSIFEFGDTTVKEIMIPRIDMVCTSTEMNLESLLQLVQKYMHSRIPLYQEKVDNIIGIIYAKDLLPYLDRKKELEFDARKLARPAYFVPEQKKIDDLLREFQNEKIHMAIVVDEYGGTAGLVTLEDIIEEIVGEIQDEHDLELPLITKISDREFIVDGAKDLEELNLELEFELPTEEGVETLGGFLYGLFGSVPREKQKVDYNGYEFIIEKIVRRRIKQVRIIKTLPGAEQK